MSGTHQRLRLAVSPNPALKVKCQDRAPTGTVFPKEPAVVLGGDRNPPLIAAGIQPAADTCFGPRGAALFGDDGPLWVCDTGHHRLLGWQRIPKQDRVPADWVIGQADFCCEGRNGKRATHAASVNVPTGICRAGRGMAVADAWNHRVLIWNGMPADHNVPADVVLGQADFAGDAANRSAPDGAGSGALYWPYGVAALGDGLAVADSENRRVLIWDRLPQENGQAADRVLGQADFLSRDENAGTDPTAASMRWPHGIALWRNHLCLADAGNNRIMVWRNMPTRPGQPCDYILGQVNERDVDHNQSLYWPRAHTLNMPYALASHGDWLIVADTANSRLLAWHIDDLATGAPARDLLGQPHFNDKGDNRWQSAVADSLCWPYGLDILGNKLLVADSGNNRVSLWELGRGGLGRGGLGRGGLGRGGLGRGGLGRGGLGRGGLGRGGLGRGGLGRGGIAP